ncbi:hypothetical protein [Chamaesiphon minutus]|uniref:Uncharacterized protein n=1 Tax=Chamaesiphon minutus (strain ATCC 27169 / PCC 6605) TaxID=1173020 RepID=K9UJX2_CHAP6|nr:hypothetical protein [Chamaesiphon minutus]AFY94499.1 hypothetical protein Cha6605_3509 [Chamaesiphon minutus PCC 6605]
MQARWEFERAGELAAQKFRAIANSLNKLAIAFYDLLLLQILENYLF